VFLRLREKQTVREKEREVFASERAADREREREREVSSLKRERGELL
jgi:hypothetical protein